VLGNHPILQLKQIGLDWQISSELPLEPIIELLSWAKVGLAPAHNQARHKPSGRLEIPESAGPRS
jgi:hypothetical protein